MPRHAAVTIASRRYLALARATATSFRRHNPGIPFFLLLADRDDGEPVDDDTLSVIRLGELGLADLDLFAFGCAELEFSYALTPFAIRHLLARGFDGVLFLKQETLVLDEVGSMLDGLEQHTALLTPHFLEPPRRADALQWEINVLRAGVFNGGVVAFARCPVAERFLAWWGVKTREACVLAVEDGIHYEQRWLDFLPSFMPGYGIVRDPGVNVGHWNLRERAIRVSGDRVTAQGGPCRIFRFSGYDPDVPELVTRYDTRSRVADMGDAAVVFERYRSLLIASGHEQSRRQRYGFATFDDGSEIPPAARTILRRLGERARRFGNPFETRKPSGFRDWLLRRQTEGTA